MTPKERVVELLTISNEGKIWYPAKGVQKERNYYCYDLDKLADQLLSLLPELCEVDIKKILRAVNAHICKYGTISKEMENMVAQTPGIIKVKNNKRK